MKVSEQKGVIEFEDVSKRYGESWAVKDLTLKVEPGEFFTLLGPSGSGKTTSLMMLAGFTPSTSGRIIVDNNDLSRVPPDKRGIGVVFQDYALFPHLTVYENLAFPLEMRKVSSEEVARRVTEILELVDLPHVATRRPEQLSGGQKQRIAVARAIIFDPPFLLMDEPLGALDRSMRLRLQSELRYLQQKLGITTIYVTHDQDEAMAMSDRMAIMNEGRIEQIGTPRELYEYPRTKFVADFLGMNNCFAVAGHSSNEFKLDNGASIQLSQDVHMSALSAKVRTVAIRPERLKLRHQEQGIPPGYDGTRGIIKSRTYLGSHTLFWVKTELLGVVQVHYLSGEDSRGFDVADQVQVVWLPKHLRGITEQ